MAHDGSMASRGEDWIVTQIQALKFGEVAAFAAADVKVFEGTESESLSGFADELFQAARTRIARVYFAQDAAEELSDGQIKMRPTYVILIGIKDFSPAGAARRGYTAGETQMWGTNAMRDLLKAALNQQRPNLTDGTTHSDKTHYEGCEIVWLPKNACVMRATVVIDEVPKA